MKVYCDEPPRYAHAKAVVIDGETVILGSTNWSNAALNRNIEVSVLIKSEKLTRQIQEYFQAIQRGEAAEAVIEDIILKAREYGQEKVRKAFAIVAEKNTDNPKKKYSYVAGILENWGK